MLNKVKIGPKLIGGFLVVSAITVIIGIMGISNMGKLNALLGTMYNMHLIGISDIKQANVDLICIGRAVRQSVAARTVEERKQIFDGIKVYEKQFKENVARGEKTAVTEAGKKMFTDLYATYDELEKGIDEYESFIGTKELAKIDVSILERIDNLRPILNKVDEKMGEMSKTKEALGNKMFEESGVMYKNMRTLLLGLLVAAVLIGMLVGIFLTLSITRPVSAIVKTANTIANDDFRNLTSVLTASADGDLSQEVKLKAELIDVKSEDEIGMLGNAFNNMIEMFKQSAVAVDQLKENVNKVSNETLEIAEKATEGLLSVRGDVKKFKGVYRQMVEGLNNTLEGIVVPVNETNEVLQSVANRDMTARVKGEYKGDMRKLKDALNTSIDNLDMALSQVAQATEQVSSASEQIAGGSQNLAQGANEQASSLEEVSSSLEEMSSMTKQSTDNARQAKILADEANANTLQGTNEMGKMTDAINKIKDSSDQTAKIVKTIDEIAMQTNLLALNAAVEAARAGEAGRGFAVVAEEVRNLAQRSAEAAKNTANMIEESVMNAENGVKISANVNTMFATINESVKKVNGLVGEIAASSEEQAQGIDQINSAVAQMDKVTQQNAANSEESASAAEELSGQSEELATMVNQFSLSKRNSSSVVNDRSRTAVAPVHVNSHSEVAVATKKKGKPSAHIAEHHKSITDNAKPVLRLSDDADGINDNRLAEF